MKREATMIELTPEQRQAVEQGEPVRIVDPATHNTYVVVRAEDFERLSGLLPSLPTAPSPEIPSAILRAQQAFWRDLPELLRKERNRGKWVAYQGDQRIALGKTGTELYQRCFQRGLQRGDFYVAQIRERDVAPWVPTPLEESLYEFTDEIPAPFPSHDQNP
jgi:hypothetical protein